VTYHEDVWDSVEPGEWLGGLRDTLMRGAGLWREQATPDVYLPPATLLYRGRDFSLRRVEALRSAEVPFDQRSRSAAVHALNAYWTGGNEAGAVIPPSQPTLIFCPSDPSAAPQCMAAVIPEQWAAGGRQPPAPTAQRATDEEGAPALPRVELGSRASRVYAVRGLSTRSPVDGWVSTEEVYRVRGELLNALLLEGITPTDGFAVARYGEVYGPGTTYYELWIGVESFSLKAARLLSAVEDPSAIANALGGLDFDRDDD
jgi:hypothetical protein